jgi:hypothetical protein
MAITEPVPTTTPSTTSDFNGETEYEGGMVRMGRKFANSPSSRRRPGSIRGALIAGRDIKVSPTEVTGPGDLTVHAALFARQRFYVEGIEHGKSATMFIYGSLTAGSISATEPRYATKIDYDKRFEYLRPASFPMTHRYEVDSWDKDWQEVEGPESPTGELARSQ